jgi:hypothetical protein
VAEEEEARMAVGATAARGFGEVWPSEVRSSWPLAPRARVDKQSRWLTTLTLTSCLLGRHLCRALIRPTCVKRGARLGPEPKHVGGNFTGLN